MANAFSLEILLIKFIPLYLYYARYQRYQYARYQYGINETLIFQSDLPLLYQRTFFGNGPYTTQYIDGVRRNSDILYQADNWPSLLHDYGRPILNNYFLPTYTTLYWWLKIDPTKFVKHRSYSQ